MSDDLLNMQDEPALDAADAAAEAETELSAGERLRAAREDKGLSLKQVAGETRQSQDTLASLESMQTSHIPATILRMQARQYARFLGLSEDEIVAEYAGARSSTNVEAMPAEVVRGDSRKVSLAIMAGGAMAVVFAVVGSVLLLVPGDRTDASELAISARVAVPAKAEIAQIDLSRENRDELSIRALSPAWIEVRGSDGTVFKSREMRAGETYFPRMSAGWTITVRDAGAFEWRMGEKTYSRLGESGQALYSVNVDSVLETIIAEQSALLAESGSRNSGQ